MGCSAGKNRKTIDALNSNQFFFNGRLRPSFTVRRRKTLNYPIPNTLTTIYEEGSNLECSVCLEKE